MPIYAGIWSDDGEAGFDFLVLGDEDVLGNRE
jgi:hypothetical protein